ncbi:MAG: hypothetical protein QCI82_08495 [Candidatus Thermoplasmatota archaeon]|nr:hypothetical protein [Candidatus Thermoplasmatota archaeon]
MEKGFYHTLEDDKIREYMKLSTKEKLMWLEEMHELTRKVLTEKEWEFRRKLLEGEI